MTRYHIVERRDALGGRIAALVQAKPSPLDPDNPSKDIKDGPAIIEGVNAVGSQFWADLLANDFVWTGQFKRFWEHNPRQAERIRQGADYD